MPLVIGPKTVFPTAHFNIATSTQEMSWSPLMAFYLTYLGSKSHAVSGSAADENYARELMQLFSIGNPSRTTSLSLTPMR